MTNAWEIFTDLFEDADQIIVEDAGLLHSKGDTFGKLPSPLIHDHNVTDGACRLYAHMHWRYGKNQKNFEGRGKIADFLGVSPTTITKRIRELEATDWIVVVERHKPNAAANFQTPFYHVFESQADTRRFRAAYKPRAGEKVRPKPELKKRKSRKGIGGNPKLKKHVATQVEPTSRGNSSSHDSPVSRGNSSSHYPDSESYPDSDIPAGAGLPEILPQETTFDDLPDYAETRKTYGAVRNRQQRFKDEVARIWGCPVSSAENTLREQMLRGVATKDEWALCNIPKDYAKRYEPEDLPRWERWELSRGVQSDVKVLISKASKVQASIMAWIDAGKPDTAPLNGHKYVDPLAAIPKDKAEADANESAQRIQAQREAERNARYGRSTG